LFVFAFFVLYLVYPDVSEVVNSLIKVC
jgi:hypothetical protein